MTSTPKYLLCPTCGNTLSEKIIPGKSHTYYCGKCGYRRERDG